MKKRNLLTTGVLTALLFATLYGFKSSPQTLDNSQDSLGTVTASILDYDHLSTLNSDPKVIDPKTSKWIPADGRSMVGSQLSKLIGVSKAPDLRGRFLRGLNTFYNDGQPNLNIATADQDDPSSNRKAGEYQSDMLKTHTHSFSHVIQVGPNEPHNINGGFRHGAGGSEGYNNYNNTGENSNGGSETRPKNITVYYYIKIN